MVDRCRCVSERFVFEWVFLVVATICLSMVLNLSRSDWLVNHEANDVLEQIAYRNFTSFCPKKRQQKPMFEQNVHSWYSCLGWFGGHPSGATFCAFGKPRFFLVKTWRSWLDQAQNPSRPSWKDMFDQGSFDTKMYEVRILDMFNFQRMTGKYIYAW